MSKDDKGISPVATGVVGAVIGAAAAAAAVVLSDEKNRKKAEQILEGLEKHGNKIFQEVSKKAKQLISNSEVASTKTEPKKLAKKARLDSAKRVTIKKK